MPDAYDRLRQLQTLRGAQGPKYLVTPGATQPPASGPPTASPPSSSVIATNSQTFRLSKGGHLLRWTGSLVPDGGWGSVPAPWPPAGDIDTSNVAVAPLSIVLVKDYYRVPGQAMYRVSVGLMEFNTTTLPDTAQVATATLRVLCSTQAIGRYAQLSARAMTLEWDDWTGVEADWTATPGTSAHNGVPLTGLSQDFSWIEIPLLNPAANVSKTSLTKLKLYISGAAPTDELPAGIDETLIYGVSIKGGGAGLPGSFYEAHPEQAPQLVVGYS